MFKNSIWIFTFLIQTFIYQPANATSSAMTIKEITGPYPSSVLYVPNDGKPHPGVIVLHGSEGGSLPYAALEAQFLAAHGYSALVFCWYNCGKLPFPFISPFDTLENVELNKTIDAIKWFKNSSYTSGKKLAIAGVSRGAEQAVILASLAEVASIVESIAVHTPSEIVESGMSWGYADKRCWVCTSLDLTCFNGSDAPAQWNWANVRWNMSCGASPKNPTTMNAWLLDSKPLTIGSAIEIEKFKKPVFITVGDQDDLWDYKKSVRLKERLVQAGQPVELHIFPGERHVFSHESESKRHELLLNFFNTNLR